ncbi:MAG: alpha-amylase family glycosyl hydrolase [Saprospiraceae bacterium]
MIKNLLLSTLIWAVFCFIANAQLVFTEPVFPSENDKVTVYFDATKGNAGLKDCNCDVYLHTGVITDKGPNQWKYVKMTWGVADPAWKLEKVSDNLYKYELGPTVRDYYGVPAGEKAVKLAFVFRNGNGSAEGKDFGGKDIFYDLTDPGTFVARLISPQAGTSVLKNEGDVLQVKGATSVNAALTIKDNGTIIKTIPSARDLVHDITVAGAGIHQVEFIAQNGADSIKESFTYLITQQVIKQDPPFGAKPGATTAANDVFLMLNAKDKQNVFAVGDFSDWKLKPEYMMRNSLDGSKWWIELKNQPNGIFKYQYSVDGILRISDPHSEVILDEINDRNIPASSYPNIPSFPAGKTSGYVSILELPRPVYNWEVKDFTRPAKTDLVIYELLVRDFSSQRNFQFVLDSLNYLKKLGVNAIQFMPVNEFNGNQSWGYDPTLHGALDKQYGSPSIFKKLVDECHKAGMAIILDVVFNHVSEKGPIAQLYSIAASPYVNAVAKHPYNVFLDMNHESPETRDYVDQCLKYWLEEYHIDGFRFDLSKGFTQVDSGSDVGKWGRYDASRIAILKHYTDVVNRTSPNAYAIMEHFADFTEEKEMTDYGMMVWQNANFNFGQAMVGGSNSSINYTYYKKNGFQFPHAVTYAESHDEERNMYRAITSGKSSSDYDIKNLPTALRRAEAAAVFLLTVPGPKMIWQFGERGFDYSINDCGNGTINNNCRLSIKPARWDYLDDPNRSRLFDVYRSLIDLKKKDPIFKDGEVTMYTGGFVKEINLVNNNQNMVVFGNFDVTEQTVFPDFPVTGKYYEYFTGDSLIVNAIDQNFTLRAGEYRIYTTKKLAKPIGGYKYYTSVTNTFTDEQDVLVYPNPSFEDEPLQITLDLNASANIVVEITDISGKVVRKLDEGKREAGNYRYEVDNLPGKGLYFARITSGNQVISKKLLKL